MQDILDKVSNFPHIRLVAFGAALVLIVWAWKFGIEGVTE